jgi:hypothetical protein
MKHAVKSSMQTLLSTLTALKKPCMQSQGWRQHLSTLRCQSLCNGFLLGNRRSIPSTKPSCSYPDYILEFTSIKCIFAYM